MGAIRANKLVKEQIAIYEKMAAVFEKVTDKASMAVVPNELDPLVKRLNEVSAELAALPAEKRDPVLAAHKAQLDAAKDKMALAKKNAATKAHGTS